MAELQSSGIDLVLVALPGFASRDQEILSGMHAAAKDAPLLLLLPKTTGLSEVEARARGASGLLTIPCYFEDLKEAIDSAILRRRQGEVAAAPALAAAARAFAEAQADLTTLSERILRAALDHTSATRGSLFLRSDDEASPYRCAAAEGLSSELIRSVAVRIGEGILGRVLERGEPLLVADVTRTDLPRPAEARSYRTASFVSVPIAGAPGEARFGGATPSSEGGDRIRTRPSPIGVLSVTDRADGEAFTAADLERLESLAALASPHIEAARHLESVERLSTVDPLTGLYNRRYFEHSLESETIRARRYGRNLTLVLLDIDDFKRYNDRFGYLAGDSLLKRVAEILRERFRQVDIVTRWGGEEFAVLLPETGKPAAADEECSAPVHFADRVRCAIAEHPFAHANEMPSGRITVSGGLATFPADTSDPRELFALANRALRKAKESGKNRIGLL